VRVAKTTRIIDHGRVRRGDNLRDAWDGRHADDVVVSEARLVERELDAGELLVEPVERGDEWQEQTSCLFAERDVAHALSKSARLAARKILSHCACNAAGGHHDLCTRLHQRFTDAELIPQRLTRRRQDVRER